MWGNSRTESEDSPGTVWGVTQRDQRGGGQGKREAPGPPSVWLHSDRLGFEGEDRAGGGGGGRLDGALETARLLSLYPAVSNGPVESVTLENSPLVWKEGRQLLRQ